MKIYIDTLGCPKNFNDSQMAAGILEEHQNVVVDTPEEADVIMVNTCGFINDAKTESIERIFDMAAYKEDGKLLVVSGCLAQRYAEELHEEMPEVDLFIGVNEYENLPELLDELSKGVRRGVVSHLCDDGFLDRYVRKPAGESVFRNHQDRGRLQQRLRLLCDPQDPGQIQKQAGGRYSGRSRGIGRGRLQGADPHRPGRDLLRYGSVRRAAPRQGWLRRLCRVDGIRWIRLMYCYEDRITDELIQTMAEEEKICDYLDIPIQHASDQVLAAMNRRSTSASIADTIRRLKEAMPDIHIRTTLIVGFPGETEEDLTLCAIS